MKYLILSIIIFCFVSSSSRAGAGEVLKDGADKKMVQEISSVSDARHKANIPGGRNRLVISYGAGGGLSFVALKNYQSDNPPYINESKENYVKPCFASNLKIGYAPSRKFFISWNARSNFFREVVDDDLNGSKWLTGGGAGLGVTFFPFKENFPVYFSGLFGYSNIFHGFELDINNFGTEIAFGAGYVFLNNFSTELSFQLGTSEKSYYYGSVYNPLIINLTINYIFWKPEKNK
jgi:hypothetical protein